LGAITNIDQTIEEGLALVRERIRIEAAYLFGSQLTGGADEDSDIDLAIFSPDVDGLNLVERINLTSGIAVQCDSSLEFHLFPSRALANARPSNFAGYIVTHGKRLI
jgi:predicted nucleotidyltransferase